MNAKSLKRDGMQLALDHAGPTFSELVISAFKGWISVRKSDGNKPFTFEEFRSFCERWDCDKWCTNHPSPHTWGAICNLAQRLNMIRKTGEYKQSKSLKNRGHYYATYIGM